MTRKREIPNLIEAIDSDSRIASIRNSIKKNKSDIDFLKKTIEQCESSIREKTIQREKLIETLTKLKYQRIGWVEKRIRVREKEIKEEKKILKMN